MRPCAPRRAIWRKRPRQKSIKENKGKFILVIDGSIPMKDGGIYCQIGGRPVLDI